MADVGERWFAVRCVLEWRGWGPDDSFTYEERLTLWQADSFDAAIEMAESEAREYAIENADAPPFVVLDFAQAYELTEPPGHGREAFSLLRDSDLDGTAYLQRHFETGTEHSQ